ncbi:MAG: hypothetical protein FIB01_04880 [Gemmatimonadetes bacterium]|nr:hypothetical protein [Gemmatimonadota bacterium]
MRAFVDRDGGRWDVVLGRESYGAFVLLFVPALAGPVRQASFPVDGYDIAVVALAELPAARIQQLLDESLPT